MCARLIIIMRLPCASRLLLFWRLLTAVYCDPCNPESFLINNGRWFDKSVSPLSAVGGKGAYCGDPYVPSAKGGPANGWTWGIPATVCAYYAKEYCQCQTQNAVGSCQCRSSFNSNIEMCYTKAYPCLQTCGKGKYVTGCGCVDCRNRVGDGCTTEVDPETGESYRACNADQAMLQKDYDDRMALFDDTTLFNFLDRKCTHDGFRTGFLCGPGQCQDCPKGHYCPDGTRALPCPSSTYQNETGQTACRPCTLATDKGGCLPGTNTTADMCDPQRGWKEIPERCGDCVPLPAGRSLTSNTVDTCTCRGIVLGMVKNAQGDCQTCFQCSGVNFNLSKNYPFYCPVAESDCVPMYFNSVETANYKCGADTSAPEMANIARRKNGMKCNGMDEKLIVLGSMPWRPGFARTLPPDSWRQLPGDSEMGLVPYYKRCPNALDATLYQWRQATESHHTLDWASNPHIDCQSIYAHECTAGNVAVLFPDDGKLIPRLKACEPCGPNGTSAGGLATQCVCDDGFGNVARIQKVLGDVPVTGQVGFSPERTCLNCSAGVAFPHVETHDEIYAEALACSTTAINSIIQRCNGEWMYVKNQQCQSCWDGTSGAPTTICTVDTKQKYNARSAPRHIPFRNRTACELCPPGKFIARRYGTVYECQACPSGSYQDTPGQCGCLAKRTYCPVGQQLILRAGDAEDLTQDTACENCTTECPDGQITIYATLEQSRAGATCDGKGKYHFGCFADATFEGLGPDTTAGHRLTFDLTSLDNGSPKGAFLEACDARLLPNRSRFVTYHASTTTGLECHFACLYGVNPKTAAAYQDAIRAHATLNNQLLLPFLPYAETQLPPASIRSVQVPTPWKPGPRARPVRWTMYDTWTRSGRDPAGAPLHENTFLYADAFLRGQKAIQPDDLCLTPEAAYAGRCPAGMRQTSFGRDGDPKMPECALLARTRSLMVVSKDEAQTAMAVLSDDAGVAVVQCMADARGYTGFRVGCERACLEERRERAQTLLASQMPGSMWHRRAAWAFYLISPDAWYTSYEAFQPYDFPYAYSTPLAAASALDLRASGTNASHNNVTAYLSTPAPFLILPAVSANSSDPCDTRCVWSQFTQKTFRYDPATAHTGDGPLEEALFQLIRPSFPVCVPCDFQTSSAGVTVSFGTSVCQQLFGTARYFDNRICLNGLPNVTELTTDHVCSKCALTKAHATLIDSRVDPAAWNDWYNVRNFGTHNKGQNVDFWNTPCRYRCAQGYGSNPNGANAYAEAPCLPCATAFQCVTNGFAMYTSADTQCGQNPQTNYAPVRATCTSCDATQNSYVNGHYVYLFQSNLSAPVSNAGLCPAICHPDYYQTFYRKADDTESVADPGVYYPITRIRCVECSRSDPNFPCADACTNDYYKNTTLKRCLACNTSRCPEGQFRERCISGAAFEDARCRVRDASALSNPATFPSGALAIGPSHAAYAALTRAKGRPSRRWLTPEERRAPGRWWIAAHPSPVPEQVALVCLNNWAWIDVRTGRSPWANFSNNNNSSSSSDTSGGVLWLDAAAFFCVECTALHTDGTDRQLYSVWNASDASTAYATPVRGLNSVLDSLTSVWGGCYACYGVRDVEAHSGTLCELPSGHSMDVPYGVSLVEVTVPGSLSLSAPGVSMDIKVSLKEEDLVVLLLDPAPAKYYYEYDPQGRRRLLQQQTAQGAANTLTPDDLIRPLVGGESNANAPSTTRLLLPAMRMPLLGNGAYFSCCDALPSAEDAEACRSLQGVHRSVYTRAGDALPQAPCARLLRAPPPPSSQRRLLQAPDIIDTRCAIGTFKPERGDTPCAFCPSGATTSGVAVIDVADCQCLPGYTRKANVCVPCPDGTYRGLADAACRPCPRRHVTQSQGATACVCEPGTFYSSLAAACLDCPAHHHCVNGALTPCPMHGLSPPRSASIADCVCDPRGFYGDLSLPNGACYPVTPGLDARGQCASGWTRVQRSQTQQQPQWIQCESGCVAGTYARVHASTGALLGCVACPADTYAIDGSLVDACTSCPMGRGTSGRTGQTSADACLCLLGVSQTTCVGCAAHQYFDPLDRVCLPCPAGWASPPNSVGVSACQCPPGSYAYGSACAPCPIGTYSHAMGLTCTSCPKGCTTNAPGQTKYAACYCGQVLLSAASVRRS